MSKKNQPELKFKRKLKINNTENDIVRFFTFNPKSDRKSVEVLIQ